MNRKRKRGHQEDAPAVASVVAAANGAHPRVAARAVTDPGVLDQGRLYREALNQTRPIASSEAEALRIADMVRNGTARPNGLTQPTAERLATFGRSLDSFTNGANPGGKAAEVVAVSDYRDLHAGRDTRIVNPPEHVASNVQDIRLAPDSSSRKDIVFGFEAKNGEVVWKYNGQVKTGGPQYVADTLVKMAKSPGYGKVGYVDARYVNADGTPRIAPDAFTNGQARRLQEAKVRLRGIPNLEKRAEQLIANIRTGKADGLDPIARQELQQLRDDIAAAYRGRGVIGRIGGGAAMAAASAAVVSLVVQLATEGKVDARTVGNAAGTGAVFGASGAAADAGLYHLGTKVLEMAPEAAKEFAQQGVAVGFCVIAIGTDLIAEVRAARRGDLTPSGAIAGAAAKTAIDLLPLVMAPLGFVGLPVLVGAQVGGRWLVGKAREADRVLEQAIEADGTLAESISQRMTAFTRTVEEVTTDCESADAIFAEAMGSTGSVAQPTFHVVKN